MSCMLLGQKGSYAGRFKSRAIEQLVMESSECFRDHCNGPPHALSGHWSG